MTTDVETVTPTFGQYIRALRLGWSFAYRRGCWVRVSDAPGGFNVELHPAGLVPSRAEKGTHRALRDLGCSVDELLDMDERLRGVKSVSKHIRIYIDA